MKNKIIALIILTALCLATLCSCVRNDNYPSRVSKIWESDDMRFTFSFPAEAGYHKAEGRAVIDEAFWHDITLEWNMAGDKVEVKDINDGGLGRKFTAKTSIDKENKTCVFTIVSSNSWDLPETITFHTLEVEHYSPSFMPEDTTLEYWIISDVAQTDWSDHTEIPGWMGAHEYYGKGYRPVAGEDGEMQDPEYCVKYIVTAWPDYSLATLHITRITVTDPAVTFWGLTVNSAVEEFDALLKSKGFIRDTEETEVKTSWGNGTYSVTFTRYDGKKAVYFDAPVSNIEGIVY